MARSIRCGIFLLILGLLLPGTGARAAGNEVTGNYRIEQVTELGPQVRVALHIRLTNNTHEELSIKTVALRDVNPQGPTLEVPASSQLQPREGTTVEHEFLISRAEYSRWRKGAFPALQVAFQGAEGRAVVHTVRLVPFSPRKPQ